MQRRLFSFLDTIVAEYRLRDVGKPIGIARYVLSASLQDTLKVSLPTIEEVEAKFGKDTIWGNRRGTEDMDIVAKNKLKS